MDKKIIQILSLCQRAGKLVSGETGCIKAVRDSSAELIILAEDASENTKKRFSDSAGFYNKKLIVIGDKLELGRAIGKDERAVLCVIDSGFAKKIAGMIEQ